MKFETKLLSDKIVKKQNIVKIFKANVLTYQNLHLVFVSVLSIQA